MGEEEPTVTGSKRLLLVPPKPTKPGTGHNASSAKASLIALF
jgi:hypothetical protein